MARGFVFIAFEMLGDTMRIATVCRRRAACDLRIERRSGLRGDDAERGALEASGGVVAARICAFRCAVEHRARQVCKFERSRINSL